LPHYKHYLMRKYNNVFPGMILYSVSDMRSDQTYEK